MCAKINDVASFQNMPRAIGGCLTFQTFFRIEAFRVLLNKQIHPGQTYWCVRASRLSRLLYPAVVRVSMYLSMPTDCSHAHTDHSGKHTSGTIDTHTSEPTPDSITVPAVLWEQRDEWVGGGIVPEQLKKWSRNRNLNRNLDLATLPIICVFFLFFLHASHVPVPSGAAQGPRITYEFVQHVKYLAKGRPLRSLPLPAVQHQLVQHHWTVHWSGQTVPFFYRFDHLEVEHKAGKGRRGSERVGSKSPSEFT